MHLSDGLLPAAHAAAWTVAALPFLAGGLRRSRQILESAHSARYQLAAATGFFFVLTALRLPSLAGSSAHASGVALGTLMFGPQVMTAMALPVLLFQALLAGHGGITTLGANVISLGVVAPWATHGIFAGCRRFGIRRDHAILLATGLGSLMTYLCTSLQLALAHPHTQGGVQSAFLQFAGLFAITQVPVAIAEALFTLVAATALQTPKQAPA